MQLQSAAWLLDYRGLPPLGVAALAGINRAVGAILLAEPALSELDLQPVILHPAGAAATARDALMLAD